LPSDGSPPLDDAPNASRFVIEREKRLSHLAEAKRLDPDFMAVGALQLKGATT
jgi:hypothetical protein